MKKMLLASVAAIALLASAPAWAEHHDKNKDNTGGAASGGGHHDQAIVGGAASGGGHHDKNNNGGAASGGGHHDQDIGTGGATTGRGHHEVIDHTGGNASGGGHHDQGITDFGRGSGGRHFGNTSNDNSTHGHTDRNTGIIFGIGGHGDRTNAGHGNRGHANGQIIFGIGGHGYRNHDNFGHGRHNSAFDQFRRAFDAPHRYHSGHYRRPHGWYYRHWNYGDFLPALFFSENYWIDDYYDYDLADPPEGTVWVRYGDDALLVDEDTGEIIQVVYGIFY